jgi:phage tail-like protein
MTDTTSFFYVLAVGIEDYAHRTNPERAVLRDSLYQVTKRAFEDVDVDWTVVEQLDRGDSIIVLVPVAGTGTGVTLAGTFVWALEQGLAERARQYNPEHRMRLLVGLAQGLCHRDARTWLGKPIDVAADLISSAVARARLAADEAALLTFVVSDEFHGDVVKQGYRQINAGSFVSLPGAAADTRAWIRVPSGTVATEVPPGSPAPEAIPAAESPAQPTAEAVEAGPVPIAAGVRAGADLRVTAANEVTARLPEDPAMRRLAEVIDDVTAPLADLVDGLPSTFTPSMAPRDVLAWMQWVLGVSPRLLTEEQSRRILPGIIRCYLSQGTAAGVEELLRLRYGVRARVVDPGGTTWSAGPATAWDDENDRVVTVRLDTDEPLPGLDEVLRSALPVQVDYRITRRASS